MNKNTDLYKLMIYLSNTLNSYGFDTQINDEVKRYSKMRFIFMFIVTVLTCIFECFGLFWNLREGEFYDYFLHTTGHILLAVQMLILYIRSDDFNIALKHIVEILNTEDAHDREHLEKLNKKAYRNCMALKILLRFSYLLMWLKYAFRAYVTHDEFKPQLFWLPYEHLYPAYIVKYILCIVVVSFLILVFFLNLYCFMIVSLIYLDLKFSNIVHMLKKVNPMSNDFALQLRTIMQKHNEVLESVNRYQNTFGWLFTVELLRSMISLTTSISSYEESEKHLIAKARNIFSLMTMLLILAQYTFIASSVTNQSLAIGEQLAKCNWEDSHGRAKNELLLMIMRTQKPTIITTFALFPLSQEMFLWVVKSVYSIVAVLFR